MLRCPTSLPPRLPARHLIRPLFLLLPLVALLLAAAPSARAIDTSADYAWMEDFETGAVLLDKNGRAPMPPSSMSKLMTLYMLFEQLKEGSLSLDDSFRVSENAWRKGGAASGGSTMFLEPNTSARVEDLVRGIIIQSGNDACIVVAENLAGSEAAFAQLMTRRAHELGLTDSTFVNATGLPEPDHLTTARDLARLTRHLISDFPQFYPIFAETEFTYNGIRQYNRNPLLYGYSAADGLKTGHTSVAGYGLTASAKSADRRLIMVLNGLDSAESRSQESARLLDWGFRSFANYHLFQAGETVTQVPVWLGQAEAVPVMIEPKVTVTLPRSAWNDTVVKAVYGGPAAAPVAAGQEIATLVIEAPDLAPVHYPLVAAEPVARLGFLGRMAAAAEHLLMGRLQ